MKKLLNTLYVRTQGAYLHKEGETVVIEVDHQKVLQLPLHSLAGIVCFGNVSCSPFLLGFCAEQDISVSFLSEHGRFLASFRGPVSGNVLLRRQQYRLADSASAAKDIASNIILGKLSNSRVVLNRAIRDHGDKIDVPRVTAATQSLVKIAARLPAAQSVDEVRGHEGQGAAEYFAVFDELIINKGKEFRFTNRNRRPPMDPVNALLSFVYTLLMHDIRSALETVGLDPYVGYLHCDRPGRASLALDIMEEFRSVIADRLVLSLINRNQVSHKGFKQALQGAVVMDDETRKTVLVEYQRRKQEAVFHPFIDDTVPIGLLYHVQAILLSRFIRGDIDGYPPFFWR